MEIINKTKEKVERIKNISIFKYIGNNDFPEVEKYINIIRFKKDEDIVREGERGGGLFVVISGRCRVIKGDTQVGTINEGEFFGEGEILLQNPASATVKADSDQVEVVYIIRGGIEQLERKSPRFTSTLYKLIAKIEMERLILLDREYAKVINELESMQKREELRKIREKIFGGIKER
ncbi:MAG: cyclic nucleotide-binding domain-containing protein [Candidatus Calescibacterium sp.]|nr:cyclic nucleotide-binding domain-containing protein [Candidatus Calescibacterium sp.]MCX7734969.1 cyclic nucleotide-binding domain-containing protein [bacterium]MDW8087905.1 cyclic nucleotide-binding domain-containing protein [Candidatus Calescibacterium sp.]